MRVSHRIVLLWVAAITLTAALGWWVWRLQPRPVIPDGVQPVVVVSIQDGDTIEVTALGPGRVLATAVTARVELLGVDAPEMRDTSGGGPQCWAAKAKSDLAELAPHGSRLWVVGDAGQAEDPGRPQLYAWRPDGVFLNARLAESGSARPVTGGGKLKYQMEISKKMDEARRAHRGLWGACSN